MPVTPSPVSRSAIVTRLRSAGCVFAEEEAELLISAAATPAQLTDMVDRRASGLPLEQVVGWADQELGAAAGHEDAGVHGDPQAAELRPAEHVLQGLAGGPPVHHGRQVGKRGGPGHEQLRFVLGEDAAGRPKPGDHDGFGKR